MAMLELTASDGHRLGAYQAAPEASPRGGIVVIQEIFGVNSHIRSICDRLAAEGYLAVAPAIFDRYQRDFETGYSPEEVEQAKTLLPGFQMDKCLLDVAAAQESVAEAGKTGLVGFCLGGSVAYAAAAQMQGFSAASCFYGGMINKFAAREPHCPVQFHYGADDASIPAENYNAVREARPEAEFYVYENAGHGFNCDQRGSYAPEAAAIAWQRMLEFFGRNLA